MRLAAKTMYLLLAFGLVASSLALNALATPAFAAPGEDDTPAHNPDLVTSCGLDILTILDESKSIATSDAVEDVRDAFEAFTQSLQNTGSRMAVVDFETVGELVIPYTTVTTASINNVFDPYINNDYDPGTPGRTKRTDWEDAFRVGRYFAPRPDLAVPHLVVFITDGDPNTVVDISKVSYDPGNPVESENEYELKPKLQHDGETSNVNSTQAKNRAVPNSNALKAMDSHVLAIAVGAALDNPGSLSRIEDMSGPDVYDGTGTFDISTHDVFKVQDFDELEDALREAAFSLCSPSVTVEKLVDLTPDPGTDDAFPQANWDMKTTVVAAGGFNWVIPTGATGDMATDATGADGFVSFQWETNQEVSSDVTVVEGDPGPGNPSGVDLVNDQSATSCVFRTPDEPNDQPLTITVRDKEFDATVPTDSIVTCTFVNRAEPAPGITLEKYTNGFDADTPTGPRIGVGEDVTWTYTVANTGNVTLDIVLTDDSLGAITCPVTALAPGDSTQCEAPGVAEIGQYDNEGTVTGTDPFGTVVEATDPSHYFGAAPGLDVEKSTVVTSSADEFDADVAPGPYVPVGDTVSFKYIVTNTGNETLTNITLDDDVLGTITSCPLDTLLAGDSMECVTFTHAVVAGQYVNVATTIADTPGGDQLIAQDPSHHFGEDAGVDIEKSTNGFDADNPTGPTIGLGQPVTWVYEVTNTGNVRLSNWAVADDQGVAVSCPKLAFIQPGVSVSCFATGTAALGQYANTGVVEATTPSMAVIGAEDPSHYIGVQANITIEKATNGEDADAPFGPFIPVGDPVAWTYEVTTTGTDPVTVIGVVDSELPAGQPTAVEDGAGFNIGDTNQNDLLEVGETWQYAANGTSEPDQYQNLSVVVGTGQVSGSVAGLDPSHYFGEEPGIHLEKLTDGVNADLPEDAVLIEIGEQVTWTYQITNSGNVPLQNVTLVDDQIGDITCPAPFIAVGDTMTCQATGTATAGLYANVGTATGEPPEGASISSTDPSHYQGYETGIIVEKATNGDDADSPTGPLIPVGDPVTWTYEVTVLDLPVGNVVLTDDQGVTPVFISGDDNGDDILDPTETWLYEATGTAAAGQYENLAEVVGHDVLEHELTDDDPSHYFGIDASIDIEKATNGEDADTPTGPTIEVGEPIAWTYVVTNLGNSPIANVTVTDDQGVTPVFVDGDTNGDDLLDPGETWTYEATGTAVAGQYANIGTVAGVDTLQQTVEATDPSHYLGFGAGIAVEKATNTHDADFAPGVPIPVVTAITWTYVVTNTGDVALSDIVLVDDQGEVPKFIGGDTNGDALLDIDEDWTYEATGSAVTGQYTNVATVTGIVTPPEDPTAAMTFAVGDALSAADPSNYFGFVAGIDVEKATNGVDADTAPGVDVLVGDTVTWTYVVTNTGDSAISDVVLVDDQGEVPVFVDGDVNGDTLLDPDEVWTFEAMGVATEGQYTNLATVTGLDLAGETVTDEDPSNYNGVTDGLPVTGVEASVLAIIALVLLGAGAVLIGLTRSRNRKQDTA